MNPTEHDPIAELTASITRSRQLSTKARADLVSATPVLICAIRHHSGQSRKIEAILWSLWNDDHQVNLSDSLAGLDTDIAVAVLAMITARAFLGGDADALLCSIIEQSGSQPPTGDTSFDLIG